MEMSKLKDELVDIIDDSCLADCDREGDIPYYINPENLAQAIINKLEKDYDIRKRVN